MSGEVELVGSNQARQRRSDPTRWSNLTEHVKRQRAVPDAFVPQSPRGANLTKHAVRADAATINSFNDFRWSCLKRPQKQTKAKKNNHSAVMPRV